MHAILLFIHHYLVDPEKPNQIQMSRVQIFLLIYLFLGFVPYLTSLTCM